MKSDRIRASFTCGDEFGMNQPSAPASVIRYGSLLKGDGKKKKENRGDKSESFDFVHFSPNQKLVKCVFDHVTLSRVVFAALQLSTIKPARVSL